MHSNGFIKNKRTLYYFRVHKHLYIFGLKVFKNTIHLKGNIGFPKRTHIHFQGTMTDSSHTKCV